MPSKVNRISPEEAWRLLEQDPDILLIDVRQPDEYEKGHIPGAILIPLPELPDKLSELKSDRSIVTYCRLGRRSLAAAQLIADEKDTEVFTIDGGIMAWDGFVAKGDIEEGLRLLEGLKGTEEFVTLAYCLEEGSRKFYLKVYEFFKEEAFKTLASVEEIHKKMISDVWPDIKIEQRFIDRMEGGLLISAVMEKVLSGNMQFQDVLEYSMQIEINSLDLYMRILKLVPAPVIDIFRGIITEEKAHLNMLGRLISSYRR